MLAYVLFGEPNIGRRRYRPAARAPRSGCRRAGEAGTGGEPDPLPEMPPRFAPALPRRPVDQRLRRRSAATAPG